MKTIIAVAFLATTLMTSAAHAADEDVVRALYSDVFSKAASPTLAEAGNKILASNWHRANIFCRLTAMTR